MGKCECPDIWTGFSENIPYCPLHNSTKETKNKVSDDFDPVMCVSSIVFFWIMLSVGLSLTWLTQS